MGEGCEIRVGTSGWHYPHWAGRFYPDKLPKSKWLEYYCRHFDTVEVNNTFYQLPKAQTFENWYAHAPPNFVFTLKANRYITHIKRLTDTTDSVERFFEAAGLLKEKLGCVLYQLPPNFHKDIEKLEAFCELAQGKAQGFFEFRHASWYCQDTYDLLDRFGLGFCVHDLGGVETPRIVTGNMIYVRFHGTTGRYSGKYSKAAMRDWAEWIRGHKERVTHVYAYFNNDINAYAIDNALLLRDVLAGY